MTSICSLTCPLLSNTNPLDTAYQPGRKDLRKKIHASSLRSPCDVGWGRSRPSECRKYSALKSKISLMVAFLSNNPLSTYGRQTLNLCHEIYHVKPLETSYVNLRHISSIFMTIVEILLPFEALLERGAYEKERRFGSHSLSH